MSFDLFILGLIQSSEFNMEDGIYALVFTVMILGGLLIVEAIHKPKPRRSRRRDRRPQELVPPVVSPTEVETEPLEEAISEPAAASTSRLSSLTETAPPPVTKTTYFAGTRWGWAIVAGFVGTLIMSAVYWIGEINNPGNVMVNPPEELALFLSEQTGSYISPVIGWVIHLVMGALLGIVYALTFSRTLTSRHPFWRGLAYGITLWFILQGAVTLIMSKEPFAMDAGDSFGFVNVLTLIGHLVYGGVLGLMYGGRRSDNF